MSEAETLIKADVASHKNAAFAKYYTITMKKLLSDSEYVTKETSRLQRLLSGANIKPADMVQFSKRTNIVSAFATSN